MVVSQKWAEALKISPEKLAAWKKLAPAETPLLVWCLMHNHVHAEDYLLWAREAYGLASLDANYFQEVFDLQSFVMTRQDPKWHPWCFPVGVWEDSTFVACVEPPTVPEENCTYLLCDAQVLHDVWSATSTNIRMTAKPKPLASVDAPAGINLNPTKTFHLSLGDDLVSAPLAHEEVQAEAAEHVNEFAPIETFLDEELDEGFGEPSEQTLSVVGESAPAVPEISEVTISDRTMTPASKKAALAAVSASAPVTAPVSAAVSVGKAAVGKTYSTLEEAEIKAAFDRLKPPYQGAMLMRCSDNLVIPYKWDSEMKFANINNATVSLEKPSCFRIVAKTMQVYHGYIVDSPIHLSFFQALGLKQNPACVTAVPLKVNEKLFGILVAFGPEAAQAPDALNKCQNVAEKLVTTLAAEWSKVA